MAKIVVLVAFSLLASAATAAAERAWVLWTQFTEAETGEPDRTTLNPTWSRIRTRCSAFTE
jgi:hypothetical protein